MIIQFWLQRQISSEAFNVILLREQLTELGIGGGQENFYDRYLVQENCLLKMEYLTFVTRSNQCFCICNHSFLHSLEMIMYLYVKQS